MEGIVGHLHRSIDGHPGQGPSIREIVEDLTAEQATARPGAGAHSIREPVHQVRHEEIMFERMGQPLLPPRGFVARMTRSVLLAMAIILVTLVVGAIGFMAAAGLGALDGLLNAALVVSGNGPAYEPAATAGKLFTIVYALTGVVAFVSVLGVVLAPIFHRILHRFHADA